MQVSAICQIGSVNKQLVVPLIWNNLLSETSFTESSKLQTIKGIIKTFISDPFATFAAIKLSNEKAKNRKIKIKKRFFSDKNKASFIQDLQTLNRQELNILKRTNTLYEYFINIYSNT